MSERNTSDNTEKLHHEHRISGPQVRERWVRRYGARDAAFRCCLTYCARSSNFSRSLYPHVFAIVKQMNSNGHDLLSWAQVPADGCQFFIQLAHLYGLE